ncbi:hypothetical protein BUE76_22745 [Cnuella takakiae]|nr:hypothetical protein BUE76_22745 [Cnuella takakiae]
MPGFNDACLPLQFGLANCCNLIACHRFCSGSIKTASAYLATWYQTRTTSLPMRSMLWATPAKDITPYPSDTLFLYSA